MSRSAAATPSRLLHLLKPHVPRLIFTIAAHFDHHITVALCRPDADIEAAAAATARQLQHVTAEKDWLMQTVMPGASLWLFSPSHCSCGVLAATTANTPLGHPSRACITPVFTVCLLLQVCLPLLLQCAWAWPAGRAACWAWLARQSPTQTRHTRCCHGSQPCVQA